MAVSAPERQHGIERIRIPLGERFADLFLFFDSDSAVLYDTGIAGTLASSVRPRLVELGLDSVGYVVVSHLDVDHCGDVGSVPVELNGAVVMAHRADAAAIMDWEVFSRERGREFAEPWGLDETPEAVAWMREVFAPGPITDVLGEETVIDIGRPIDVWHVPGHTHGHLAVHDLDNDVLAIADAVLGSAVPLADGSPSFPPTYRHVDDYLATIARIRRAAPHMLLTAHYGDFIGDDVIAFMDESAAFVERMDEEVLHALGSEPRSLGQIVDIVNPRIASWPVSGTRTALAFPVAGHLERAHAAGQVHRDLVDDVWVWSR